MLSKKKEIAQDEGIRTEEGARYAKGRLGVMVTLRSQNIYCVWSSKERVHYGAVQSLER